MMNFPLNLAVGFAQPVNQVGNYVYYKAGSAGGADPSIKVKTDQGDEYVLMPGQGFRLDKKTFTNLQVTNYGGQATIIGALLIADGGFFDNRMSGSVEVIDGGRTRALNNGSFMGVAAIGPGAGNIGIVQLWNPAASGKNVFVDSVKINSAAANGIYMLDSNAALPTLYSTAAPKRLGGSVSVMELRVNQQAAQPAGRNMWSGSVAAGSVIPIDLKGSILIPPGYGLMVNGNTAAVNINASFEWYEETA